jgi:hypothetical protein
MTANTNRIVIHVEGGLVQAVYAERDEPIRVAIMDFDVGADDDVLFLEDGTAYIGYIEHPFISAERVDSLFTALGKAPSLDE